MYRNQFLFGLEKVGLVDGWALWLALVGTAGERASGSCAEVFVQSGFAMCAWFRRRC